MFGFSHIVETYEAASGAERASAHRAGAPASASTSTPLKTQGTQLFILL